MMEKWERMAEERRIEHADTVESAGTVTQAETVENVEHADVTIVPKVGLTKAEGVTRLLAYVLGIVVSIAVILAFLTTLLNSRSDKQALEISQRSERTAIAQRAELQSQLEEVNARLATTTQEQAAADKLNQERADCANAYARRVSDAAQVSAAAINVFVVAISDPNEDQPTKAANFPGRRAALDSATSAYAQAVSDRRQYVDAGSPLPCPLTVG